MKSQVYRTILFCAVATVLFSAVTPRESFAIDESLSISAQPPVIPAEENPADHPEILTAEDFAEPLNELIEELKLALEALANDE